MPDPKSIRAVAQRLLPRVDEMTNTMVNGYRERIPEYPRILEKHHEDVFEVSRAALLIFLQLVIQQRDATEQELALIRASGRARAAQGLNRFIGHLHRVFGREQNRAGGIVARGLAGVARPRDLIDVSARRSERDIHVGDPGLH